MGASEEAALAPPGSRAGGRGQASGPVDQSWESPVGNKGRKNDP